MKNFPLCIFFLLLTGCVPVVETFLAPSAKEGKLVAPICSESFGPLKVLKLYSTGLNISATADILKEKPGLVSSNIGDHHKITIWLTLSPVSNLDLDLSSAVFFIKTPEGSKFEIKPYNSTLTRYDYNKNETITVGSTTEIIKVDSNLEYFLQFFIDKKWENNFEFIASGIEADNYSVKIPVVNFKKTKKFIIYPLNC